MLQDEFKWACPKCGTTIRGQGQATLAWAKSQHEYWEHERKERAEEVARNAYIAPPTSSSFLTNGRAILDDAFYDGARLTSFDRNVLSTYQICWNAPKQLLHP